MQAESERNQQWRIEVRAKAKSFNFKFKAVKLSPAWKLHRIRVLLHIHKLFFFLVNSKSGASSPNQSRRTLRSRFLCAFDKFCSIFAKKPRNRLKSWPRNYLDQLQLCATQAPIYRIGSLFAAVVLIFALCKGVFLKYVLVIYLFIALVFTKKREAANSGKLFAVSMVLAFCFVLSDLYNYCYVKKVESFYSRWVWYWKIWKFVGSKVLDTT